MEVIQALTGSALVAVLGYLAHGHTQMRVVLAEILIRIDTIEKNTKGKTTR